MDESPDIGPQVRDSLTEFFDHEPIVSLLTVCDQAETQILGLVSFFVLNELRLSAENDSLRFSEISDDQFFFDGVVYELKLSEHETEPILQIAILSPAEYHSQPIPKAKKIQLDSVGRYLEISIRTPRVFLKHRSRLAEAAKTVLESGYRWLMEFVQATLSASEQRAADDLYSHVRQLFPNKVSENIWLYALVDEEGIYIPDRLAREVAANRAKKRLMAVSKSPIEVMVDFCTRVLDLDELFSKVAIREDSTIVGEVENAPYAESGIQIAEEIIMQLDRMIVQPLVREGRTLLVAGYPVELRSKVEPVLFKERKSFRNILERQATALRRVTRVAKEYGVSVGTQNETRLERIAQNVRWVEFKPKIFGVEIKVHNIVADAARLWRPKKP